MCLRLLYKQLVREHRYSKAQAISLLVILL